MKWQLLIFISLKSNGIDFLRNNLRYKYDCQIVANRIELSEWNNQNSTAASEKEKRKEVCSHFSV